MIGDDTGDNISSLNPFYCELTAQYWAWKNTSDDYVGFLHYRRHFIFNEQTKDEENEWGVVEYPFVSTNYLKSAGLNDDTIKHIVFKNDLVTMTPWNVSNAGSINNYDHYKSSSPYLHIEDYNEMLRILCEKYPDYAEDAKSYGNSKFGYYTNMFIMKHDLFEEYCRFLFDILFELSKIVDLSKYSEQERRIFGYLSEWIFGIYITRLKRVSDYKIKELRRTFITYPDVQNFDIHCCSACDNNYAKHLGVLLTSVKANKGPEKVCYWIISDGITDKNKELLKRIRSTEFQIYLIEHIHTYNNALQKTLETNPHLSLACYDKLFIPDYLPLYIDRIIYLDTDMVCRNSLLELYASDFHNFWVCGVKDVLNDENCKRLNLETYINSGMLLIDCNKWRANNVSRSFTEYISVNIRNPKAIFYQDQDVLNVVLKGKIGYVNAKWNAQTSSYPGCEEQNEIGKSAIVIHFISDKKPWLKNNDNPFEEEYKKYLRLSPWSGTNCYVGCVHITKRQTFVQKYLSILVKHLFH